GVLRCAVRLNDQATVRGWCGTWKKLAWGPHFEDIAELCLELSGRGQDSLAAELSKAEAERMATPRALYLAARCVERTGDMTTGLDWVQQAAERGLRDGDEQVAIAAQALKVAWQGRVDDDSAVSDASTLDLSKVPKELLAEVVSAKRRASSRFVRASAIAALEALATESPWAESAMLLAARHADELGDRLTSLERDRVAAVLAHWKDQAQRTLALERLQLGADLAAASPEERGKLFEEALGSSSATSLEVARCVLRGQPLLGVSSVVSPALRAAGHLVAGANAEAADALRELLGNVPLDASAPTWTATRLALLSHDDGLVALGGQVAKELTRTVVAPSGQRWSNLARHVEASGALETAVPVWRKGVEQGETEAREGLQEALARLGHWCAGKGERGRALELLREAKGF
ncbi:MAG: hypothetical protein WCI05_10220, partial [Myxococcales bacterium]